MITNQEFTIRRMMDDEQDYKVMLKWLCDKEVQKYYEGRDKEFTYDSVVKHYQPRSNGESYVISCILEYNNDPIGYLQYYEIDEEDNEKFELDNELTGYGIDIFIGERDYWNKGYGTRIMKLMIKFIFDHCRSDFICIDPQTWNKRAIRVYEKAGFERLKVIPKNELHEGEYKDNLIMIIWRKDWLKSC